MTRCWSTRVMVCQFIAQWPKTTLVHTHWLGVPAPGPLTLPLNHLSLRRNGRSIRESCQKGQEVRKRMSTQNFGDATHWKRAQRVRRRARSESCNAWCRRTVYMKAGGHEREESNDRLGLCVLRSTVVCVCSTFAGLIFEEIRVFIYP
jgi:hypothetical protein